MKDQGRMPRADVLHLKVGHAREDLERVGDLLALVVIVSTDVLLEPAQHRFEALLAEEGGHLALNEICV